VLAEEFIRDVFGLGVDSEHDSGDICHIRFLKRRLQGRTNRVRPASLSRRGLIEGHAQSRPQERHQRILVEAVIAPQHRLARSGLFRLIRHLNYMLSINPELGLALATNAYRTIFAGLFLYLIPLTLRIRREGRVMREAFSNY
jgi:hypothetical protein